MYPLYGLRTASQTISTPQYKVRPQPKELCNPRSGCEPAANKLLQPMKPMRTGSQNRHALQKSIATASHCLQPIRIVRTRQPSVDSHWFDASQRTSATAAKITRQPKIEVRPQPRRACNPEKPCEPASHSISGTHKDIANAAKIDRESQEELRTGSHSVSATHAYRATSPPPPHHAGGVGWGVLHFLQLFPLHYFRY